MERQMTRDEIEKISAVGPYCFETDREERWYEIGCIDCLRAADTEPNLESLWHEVSEEPELNQWFLAQIGDDAFDTFIMAMDKNEDWRKWSKGINLKRWAYIRDLLPRQFENSEQLKGGEK